MVIKGIRHIRIIFFCIEEASIIVNINKKSAVAFISSVVPLKSLALVKHLNGQINNKVVI